MRKIRNLSSRVIDRIPASALIEVWVIAAVAEVEGNGLEWRGTFKCVSPRFRGGSPAVGMAGGRIARTDQGLGNDTEIIMVFAP